MSNQEKPNINPGPLNELKQQLQNSGVDVSKWGTRQAKTLQHLLKEIKDGETILVKNNEGKLLRENIVGNAIIYYISSEGKKYRLREEKQIFKDGRERQRALFHVSEKIKTTEDPKEAMTRGIKEELGIKSEINLTQIDTNIELLISPSYPGLQTQYILHKFETILNDEQFKPEGFIEEQPDKSTYFVWEEVK